MPGTVTIDIDGIIATITTSEQVPISMYLRMAPTGRRTERRQQLVVSLSGGLMYAN